MEKHAGAQTCQLKLAFVDGYPPVLELDIADDGRGLARETARGLGLLSMQARAAEVGGIKGHAPIDVGGPKREMFDAHAVPVSDPARETGVDVRAVRM